MFMFIIVSAQESFFPSEGLRLHLSVKASGFDIEIPENITRSNKRKNPTHFGLVQYRRIAIPSLTFHYLKAPQSYSSKPVLL